MVEQRHTHRFRIELPASFQLVKKPYVSMATTLDVSATGLCIRTREPLHKGQKVILRVRLPDEELLTLDTRVVRVEEDSSLMNREYKVGIQIVDQLKGDQVKFVKFYAKLLSKDAGP